MKPQTLALPFLLTPSHVLAQSYPECTRELAQTDACLAVINANACYNQFKFNNAQALQCVDAANDTERKKKVESLLFLLLTFSVL
ncbi:unnamed protein product [Periconia digitata]|uniref:Uncharacterized protein n=1 Tax=Periconia digitata TaxID=1303443 RepID=A0A9W4XLI6_9PLEO|nr:unnamed protein product [Periconia digitata]